MSWNMKILSIIIPVYNVEAYLEKCLDSAIRPELDGYEIIAVNDGSTDSSPNILERYAERYPSLVRVVTKENGGLGSARNAALPVAEGEFVFFLDSDDYVPENTVSEMLDTCRNAEFDICFFDMDSVDEEGKILEHVTGANVTGPFTLDGNPEVLLCRMNACNKLFRRTLFTENGILFKDREWYEDVSSVPKLYALAGMMYYQPKTWYKYLLRTGSIMNNRNIARNLEIISAVDSTLSFYREHGLFEKYHSQLEYMAFYNELVTASVRINLADRNSSYQDDLLDWFRENFPDYRDNPYVKNMPAKYRLLDYLISHRMHRVLNLVMAANEKVKR